MIKQIVSVMLIVLLVNLAAAPSAFAADKLKKEAKHAAKVKKGIAKLGTGKDAKIKVKLKDGTKLKGFVSEINEDSFTVIDPETGASTSVPYSNARQITGNNPSTRKYVFVGLLVLLLIIAASVD